MPSWKSPWNAPGCALWSLWGGLRFGKAAVWHVFTLDAGSWLEFGGWGGWRVATQTISYDISLSTQAYEETVNQGRASPQENIQEALLDFKPNCSVFACLLYVHTPNNPTIHLPGFRQGTYANTCSCRGLSKRACRGQCSHPKGQKLIWHITLRYLFKFTHILYFFFSTATVMWGLQVCLLVCKRTCLPVLETLSWHTAPLWLSNVLYDS